MARLNTHITPTPGRSSSLYRDPTPRSQLRDSSTRASTAYSVLSPVNSDKENEEPESRTTTPRPSMSKSSGRRTLVPSSRMPTPVSAGSSSSGNANKRRRTDDYNRNDDSPAPTPDGTDADPDAKWYDPNQDQNERREVRTNIRQNHREMEAMRDELVQRDDNRLVEHIKLGDQLMTGVRQTSDAVLDSRFLVSASELALKKTRNNLRGDVAISLDLDQFVSKCITFMRLGGRTAAEGEPETMSTQARHRRRTAADEDEDENGDGLDWAVLGAKACFPHNKRPPVCGFLLGPLSVQKRARATQVRRGRSQRQPAGPAVKPQELQVSDIKQSESTNLTHLVKDIKKVMEDHLGKNEEEIETELSQIEDADEEVFKEVCRRRRVSLTPDQELAVSLFDFVVNPHSFGQTIENLFYVSFLIREGVVRVTLDNDGLPVLRPCQPHSVEEHREQNVSKHQAVLSLDHMTYMKLIKAFDIKEPLIPHRQPEETSVSNRGWYG